MKHSYYLVWLILFFGGGGLQAQHYSAIHGSNYSGSLGVYNNPASAVVSPFKWDLTLFGLQYQTITNAVKGPNFPFYLSSDATFRGSEGNYARKADINYNIRLLGIRYAINKDNAISAGLNFRGYTQAGTSAINYNDSVVGPRSFLSMNEQNRVLKLDMTSSAWMELYGSYGRTIHDREAGRLNAGITLKLLRGMSGAFVQARDVGVERYEDNDRIAYKIMNGTARYGYSSNHGDGNSFEAADLFSASKTGLAIDLGVEYLIKTQAVTSVYDVIEPNEYEWKIGFSLLDLGWNTFTYSNQSRDVSSLKSDVSSTILQDKFFTVTDIGSFNDSLATIVDRSEVLTGDFNIMNPARAVLNVDRYISGNFYVNGELSVNLASAGNNMSVVKETNLITITPRWETRKLGFYLPLQYTRHGNFWIGGALKAGPLLLGTHNLLNAFSKNQNINGGAYIALIIRPSEFIKNALDMQYECPPY